MTRDNIMEAMNGIGDHLIAEAAQKLGFLSDTPVTHKPKRRSAFSRFMNSGWGVAAVCALVAVSVMGGIIWAGNRPGISPPASTSEETTAPLEIETFLETEISSEMISETQTETLPDTNPEETTAREAETMEPHDAHIWADWQFVQAPTCSEGGSRARRCAYEGCLVTQHERLPAGRHVYNDEGFCMSCLRTLSRNDTYLTFTSNGDGTCSVGCHIANLYLDPVLVLPNYSPDGDLVTAIDDTAFLGKVSSIGGTAYYAGKNLTSVTLPAALETIGRGAFDGCEQLAEVVFPESLRCVGDNAFHSTALTAVTLPGGLSSIGTYAFGDCFLLKSVYIPASVTEIGEYAFGCCESLERLSFGEGSALTAIPPQFAVQCTSLKEISLPATVTCVGEYAFSRSALTSVVLPKGLTEIDNGAFLNCKDLSSIQIPDSLMRVGRRAFHGTDSLSLSLFDGCLYLAVGDNPYGILVAVDEKTRTSVEVHPDILLIDEAAFDGCPKLAILTYDGTMEEWGAVRYVFPERPDVMINIIICSDGHIVINAALL